MAHVDRVARGTGIHTVIRAGTTQGRVFAGRTLRAAGSANGRRVRARSAPNTERLVTLCRKRGELARRAGRTSVIYDIFIRTSNAYCACLAV